VSSEELKKYNPDDLLYHKDGRVSRSGDSVVYEITDTGFKAFGDPEVQDEIEAKMKELGVEVEHQLPDKIYAMRLRQTK
jgi:hypothetical protein